jgi:phosphoribosylformylglycinamidine (FGAM) synthase PurS component
LFRITIRDDESPREKIEEQIEQMSQKLLANPIVETYRVDVES